MNTSDFASNLRDELTHLQSLVNEARELLKMIEEKLTSASKSLRESATSRND